MKKLVIIITCFLLIICSAGCKKCKQSEKTNIADDMISVDIKSEYSDKYENKEFQISDFQYDNVEYFIYSYWIENERESYGSLVIFLKKVA